VSVIRSLSRFLEHLREAVRENPVAAALIGGGALWLLMDNGRLKTAASAVRDRFFAPDEQDQRDAISIPLLRATPTSWP
jgi:hypothetical protein